jgi:hypothetical protein
VTDVRLDSMPGCMRELATCNQELAEFAHTWATQTGELKQLEKRYQRLYQSAMRGTKGKNAEERQATAHAAVEEVDPHLAERIEELIGSVERSKTLWKSIDRRSDNVRSILSAHKEAHKTEPYVPPGRDQRGNQ